MIKAVIFDWGGVLIDNPVEGHINYCAKHLRVETPAFVAAFHRYSQLFDTGFITETDLWVKVCLDLKVDLPKTDSLWGDAFRVVYSPKTEVWNLVSQLKNRSGYKTAILSNTEIPAVDYFNDHNLDQFFDESIFSCVEKTRKPDPLIYEIALARLKVKADEAVFIDDREDYAQGAKAVGLRVIIFKNFDQLKDELATHGVKIDPS